MYTGADLFDFLGADETDGLADLIAEDPQRTDPYLVLGDLLQARSDPRGELIAVQHARLSDPDDPDLVAAELALLRAYRNELLEAVAPFTDDVQVRWYLGFIEYARVDPLELRSLSTVGMLRALLESLSGRFIRDLSVGRMVPQPAGRQAYYDGVLDVLKEVGVPALRSLTLGRPSDAYDLERRPVAVHLRRVRLVTGLHLERLAVYGRNVQVWLDGWPGLKELAVLSSALDAGSLWRLATLAAPQLERFNLWVGDAQSPDSRCRALRQLVRAEGMPCLRHLALQQVPETDELVEMLVGSAVLPRLHTLGLGMGTLSDAGAAAIWENREAFAHLRLLNLSDNYISPSWHERLQSVCRVVRIGYQQSSYGRRIINLLR